MTIRTWGLCIACAFLLGLFVVLGCTPQQQAAAAAGAVADVLGAAQQSSGSSANGATAVATPTRTTAVPAAARQQVLIRPNGRGGYDSSAAQKAAIARAHWISDHYGVTKVTRYGTGGKALTTMPTTVPVSSSSIRTRPGTTRPAAATPVTRAPANR